MGGSCLLDQPKLVLVAVNLELTVNIFTLSVIRVTHTHVGVGNGDQQQHHQRKEDATTNDDCHGVRIHAGGCSFRSHNQRVQLISPNVLTRPCLYDKHWSEK